MAGDYVQSVVEAKGGERRHDPQEAEERERKEKRRMRENKARNEREKRMSG
jgi:hypothetical protein